MAAIIYKSICLFLLCIAFSLQSISQPLALHQLKKPGNMGKEFFFSFPPSYEVSGTNLLKLYVACAVRTKVRVEVEGKGFIQEKFTVPNGVIDFTLAPGVGQVVSKPVNDGFPMEQVYQLAAVHIIAQDPIVVYGLTRFDYTADGFLALPVEALGKEYIVASIADMSWMYPGLNLPSETVISATENNTIVSLTVGGNDNTQTVGGLKAGQTKTFTMQRGDVLAVGTGTSKKSGDLSGTKISATKPVSVVSGNVCANVPVDLRWCDFIAEMEIPTHSWGTTYYVPRDPKRHNSAVMKIFAKEPDTKVYRNGQYWQTIQTAGGKEGTGFLHGRVDNNANSVAVITADKPISITTFSPGQEDDNVPADPDQMLILPTESFGKEFIFCTPGIKGAKGFSNNNVTIVYPLSPNNTIPDDLKIAVLQGGETNIAWRLVSAMFGPAVGDVFYVESGGKKYAAKVCNLPQDGMYAIQCNEPIGIYSTGSSDYDGYQMPSGSVIVDVTKKADKEVPVPTFTLTKRPEIHGTVRDFPADETIRSNLSKITLVNALSDNVDFIVAQPPHNLESVDWTIFVTDSAREATALIVFTDRAGNDTTISISYTPTPAILTPNGTSFCPGDKLVLTGTAGYAKYKWSIGDTTRSITISSEAQIQQPITLTVTTFSGKEITSQSIIITVLPLSPTPQVRLSKDTLYIENKDEYESIGLYRDNELVNLGTKGYFVLNMKGKYTIKGKNKKDCWSAASADVSYTPTVGVSDEEDLPFLLYPQPAQQNMVFEMNSVYPVELTICSLLGEETITVSITESGAIKHVLDLSSLPAGSYVLRVKSGGEYYACKFMKN